MIESIHDPIEVIAVFTGGVMKPVRFRWKNKTVKVSKVTGDWIRHKGQNKIHYFALLAENQDYYEVRYDTRDDRETPRSGADFRSEYRSGTKVPSSGGGSNAAVRHAGFDFDVYFPVGGRQVLALALHGMEVSTALPGPADLYRLGGFRTFLELQVYRVKKQAHFI